MTSVLLNSLKELGRRSKVRLAEHFIALSQKVLLAPFP